MSHPLNPLSLLPPTGRDSLPYVLKSTTPIQESSSSSSPDLGVYNLPPNLGKGDVLTFPAGMEGKEEDVKYKVKRGERRLRAYLRAYL